MWVISVGDRKQELPEQHDNMKKQSLYCPVKNMNPQKLRQFLCGFYVDIPVHISDGCFPPRQRPGYLPKNQVSHPPTTPPTTYPMQPLSLSPCPGPHLWWKHSLNPRRPQPDQRPPTYIVELQCQTWPATSLWKRGYLGHQKSSSQIDFEPKLIKRDEERLFIFIKGKSHQDDVSILNIYATNLVVVLPPMNNFPTSLPKFIIGCIKKNIYFICVCILPTCMGVS